MWLLLMACSCLVAHLLLWYCHITFHDSLLDVCHWQLIKETFNWFPERYALIFADGDAKKSHLIVISLSQHATAEIELFWSHYDLTFGDGFHHLEQAITSWEFRKKVMVTVSNGYWLSRKSYYYMAVSYDQLMVPILSPLRKSIAAFCWCNFPSTSFLQCSAFGLSAKSDWPVYTLLDKHIPKWAVLSCMCLKLLQ